MQKLSIIMFAVSLVACGGTSRPESFEPAERATAQSPQGYTAAEYELATPRGDLGDVKVWSRGARVMEVNGVSRTVVHVGFEVDNSSVWAIELEELAMDSAMLDRQILSGIEPARIDGSTTVQPGRVNEINAYFPLPAGVSPQEVDAFRIRWRVRSPDVVYSQHTPFLENVSEAVAYYYTPYYDPFYYDWYFHHPRIIVHRYPYRHYHRYR
jgi:hypothetical protein